MVSEKKPTNFCRTTLMICLLRSLGFQGQSFTICLTLSRKSSMLIANACQWKHPKKYFLEKKNVLPFYVDCEFWFRVRCKQFQVNPCVRLVKVNLKLNLSGRSELTYWEPVKRILILSARVISNYLSFWGQKRCRLLRWFCGYRCLKYSMKFWLNSLRSNNIFSQIIGLFFNCNWTLLN